MFNVKKDSCNNYVVKNTPAFVNKFTTLFITLHVLIFILLLIDNFKITSDSFYVFWAIHIALRYITSIRE